MIAKYQANAWVRDTTSDWWMLASIESEIYKAISEQKFHCDWYSPARHKLTQSEINILYSTINILKDHYGYAVRYTVLKPNKDLQTSRVKIHISWE